MTNQQPFDVAQLAAATNPALDSGNRELTPPSRNDYRLTQTTVQQTVLKNPEVAWMEATRGLQGDLIRSLREYKTGWRDRTTIALHRQRMIDEVTSQYVDYLREEAKLASAAALQARDTVLRHELTKLRANLLVQIADITGRAVTDIEAIFQSHAARISSPLLQAAYARFIMNKVLELLEQPQA